jgi:hypothetical protein
MSTPTDKSNSPLGLKSLLERNLPRTLDEQVRHAYLNLLQKVESVIAKAVTEADGMRHGGNDEGAEALQAVVDDLTFAWSKNVALKTKLSHRG